eukprot:2324850-Alexandrium_andersonii.AAC.1
MKQGGLRRGCGTLTAREAWAQTGLRSASGWRRQGREARTACSPIRRPQQARAPPWADVDCLVELAAGAEAVELLSWP